MKNQDIICRFCFKNCDGKLKSIEGSLEEMLDTLLLKMNPDLSESHFICTSCEDVLNGCFEFKSTCLFMQTNLISNNIEIAKANPNGVASSENLNTCSLCISVLKNCNFISFNNVDEEMLDQVFEKFIPELDLSVAMEPAICKACYEHLQIYFDVMRNCSILEKTARVDGKSLMSPQGAPKCSSSRDILCKENENNVGVIKIEPIFCGEEENEFDNKDYMERDDTGSIGVLKFTSGNMLTGNYDREVVEIKTEATYCEKLENEDETEQSGLKRLRDMPNGTSREIYEAKPIKIEGVICAENEFEFDCKNCTEMNDAKCLDLLQFTSMNMTCNGVGIKPEEMFCENLKTEDEIKHEFFFVDHKLNDVEQLSSKDPIKCEEKVNENSTETDDENFLPCSREKFEVALKDQCSFDSVVRDPLEAVINDFSEKGQCFDLQPLVSESLLSKSNEECKNDFGRPEPITDLSDRTSLQQVAKSSSLGRKLTPKNYSEEPVLKNTQPIHKKKLRTVRFKCPICPYRAKFAYQINCHSLVHKDPSDMAMYQCEYCSYQTKHKSAIVDHTLLHTNVLNAKVYQCEYCPFKTRYKHSYFRHLSNHKIIKITDTLYQCDFCSFTSTHKKGLITHKEIHKNPMEKKVFSCCFCSFQTSYKRFLTRHSLSHKNPSAIPTYQCKSCTFITKSRSALRSHKLIHKKETLITSLFTKFICKK